MLKPENVEIRFNEEESVLEVFGQKVSIAERGKITISHIILRYIFVDNADNLDDDFFFSEIADDEYGDEEYNWRKYYTACDTLKSKIKRQTKQNLDDLFIYNSGKRGKIKLNPKYLKT